MKLRMRWVLAMLIVSAAAPPAIAAPAPAPAPITAAAVEQATVFEPVGPKTHSAAALRIQVLLDRRRFSPGEIDGSYGDTLKIALIGFQKFSGLSPSGLVDAPTWNALAGDAKPILVPYTLTPDDVAGPFQPIPKDLMEQAELPRLGYGSAAEQLGEHFHASPKLLAELNPGKDLGKAGEQVLVPNVVPLVGALDGVDHLVVDKSDRTVSMAGADGRVMAQYPASTGSQHDPLPIGAWKINGIRHEPDFHYNPALFWDAKKKKGQAKATLPPGPNNPVGIVWMDLSKDHYGIHGTPEPHNISKTESHGCIRMTNWDAWTVAQSVHAGTPAILQP